MLITILMCGILTACAGSENAAAGDSASPAASDAAVSTETEASVKADATADEADSDSGITKYGIAFSTLDGNPDDAEETTISLPVTDSDEAVSLYMIFSPAVISYVTQLSEDNIAWKTFCEKTGLNLDIHLVHPGSKSTEVALMIASSNFYDVMQDVVSSYSGGSDQAIEDGFVYDITDMVRQNAPNFWSKITYSEESYENVCTQSGKLAGFTRISSDLQGDKGMIIRQDWLDKVGMEKPSTVGELHDVLLAFKNQIGTDSAMWLPGTGTYLNTGILNAFYGSGDYYVKDGTVGFGLVDDSFKDYLTLMNQWYTEGLIYPDFYSNTTDTMVEDISLVSEKNMGLAYTESAKLPAFNSTIEGSRWVALSSPVANDGDVLHTGGTKAYYCEMVDLSITTACDCPETVCKAFDYLYTDEGSLLANYGVQDVTYTLDADGKPQFTEVITADPNNDLKTQIMLNCFDIGPYVKDVYRTASTETDDQIESYDIWYNGTDNDMAWNMPDRVSLNTDESSQYTNYYSEYNTYYLEMAAQFIMGKISLDEYDEYASTMKELGVTACIELYQAAYDRYALQK